MTGRPRPVSTRAHPRRRRARQVATWFAGIATATVIAVITALATGLVDGLLGADDLAEPLVTVKPDSNDVNGCNGVIVIGKDLGELEPLPGGFHKRYWREFAERHHGISGPPGVRSAQVIVQGSNEKAVVLTSLEFEVIRKPVPRGVWVHSACGSPVGVRRLEVDLDVDPPRVTYRPAESARGVDRSSQPITFPYQVSEDDPEVFSIEARAERCDCSWTATLHWVADGRRGSTKITNSGRPFRVIGGAKLKDTLHVPS